MFNTDPQAPLVRIIAALAGLAAVGFGVNAIWVQGDLHYVNWFGQLVFAPLAILLGLVIVFGAIFKPEILGRSPRGAKH